MSIALPLIVVLLLAGVFLFLAVRAARARTWLKWPGMILSGLLGLVLLAVGVVSLIGWNKLVNAPHEYSVADVQVAGTAEQVARGERIAAICADCHSSTGTTLLDGSAEDFLSDPSAPPLGSMWGPNLTPAGSIKDWSDGEVIRAIREGIDNEGKPLLIMPSMAFHNMSDEDVQAVVAYLRSQPAVEREVPERKMGFLATLLLGAGMFPSSAQEPITAPVVAPAKGTADYGKYLVAMSGCADCHGPELDGNGIFGPGVNITTIVPNWAEDDLFTFFRQQVDPETGRAISPDDMPVHSYNIMFSDEDLSDLYKYLHGLQPVTTAK